MTLHTNHRVGDKVDVSFSGTVYEVNQYGLVITFDKQDRREVGGLPQRAVIAHGQQIDVVKHLAPEPSVGSVVVSVGGPNGSTLLTAKRWVEGWSYANDSKTLFTWADINTREILRVFYA